MLIGTSGGMAVLAESEFSRFPFSVVSCGLFADKEPRSPEQVTERLDRLIKDIKERWHQSVIGTPKEENKSGDVLVVAHGHILRAFAMRWAGKTLQDGPAFLLEAGGIGTLR